MSPPRCPTPSRPTASSPSASALPTGFSPLAFVGDDDKTLTGSESDLGRLVAAVLGLKPEFNNDTWDNRFVGVDSGANEVGFTTITDTEQRKKKYDFASCLIAAITKKGNGLAKALADAIYYLIQNGQYAQCLAAYDLSNEAVATSQVNPPGLPKSNV